MAAEAVGQFNQALALREDDPRALSGLAWVRATAADASVRNAQQAVALGERAVSLTQQRDLSALDALAAAYASAGRYEEAAVVARSAIAQANVSGQSNVVAQFRERLSLYQKRQPYRMPSR